MSHLLPTGIVLDPCSCRRSTAGPRPPCAESKNEGVRSDHGKASTAFSFSLVHFWSLSSDLEITFIIGTKEATFLMKPCCAFKIFICPKTKSLENSFLYCSLCKCLDFKMRTEAYQYSNRSRTWQSESSRVHRMSAGWGGQHQGGGQRGTVTETRCPQTRSWLPDWELVDKQTAADDRW